jgi:hypothetical protein
MKPAATPADLAAAARRLAVALAEFAERAERTPDAGAAARPQRSRTPGPKRGAVSDDEIRDRERLWLAYFHLKVEETSGRVYNRMKGEPNPTSQIAFAVRHRLNPSELSRWFSRTCGIPAGSIPDRNIRRALLADIERMRAATRTAAGPAARPAANSLGMAADSHLKPAGLPLT